MPNKYCCENNTLDTRIVYVCVRFLAGSLIDVVMRGKVMQVLVWSVFSSITMFAWLSGNETEKIWVTSIKFGGEGEKKRKKSWTR